MKNRKRLTQTFRGELMAAFVGIGVIPFIICCIALIQVLLMRTEKEAERTALNISTEVGAELDYMLEEIENLSERIAGNVKLSQALLLKEDSFDYVIYKELYDKTSAYRDFACFELYDVEGNCRFSTDSSFDNRKVPTYWGLLKKAYMSPYQLVSRAGGLDEKDSKTSLCFARVVIPYDKLCGYFVIRVSEDSIVSLLKNAYGATDGIAILDKYLNSIFEGGISSDIDIDRLLRSRYLNGEDPEGDYNGKSINFTKLSKGDFYVSVVRPKSFSEDTLSRMYRILIVMAGIILVLCIIISNIFAKSFSKPIRVMRDKMREVRKGNLDVYIDPKWHNEFSDLSNSFNHMTSELKDYMELQVEQQKELNGTQIAMMQAQLNPHFLYNTLDTMKWVAKANHVPELVTLVSKLSKILRASISKEQFVTLKSEMELVDSYAEIQKIRFDGKFECTCDYPSELENVMVPKLVVQPIVENSVIHGFEDATDGHILVRAYSDMAENGMRTLVIVVKDDGRGITDEEIERLKKPDPNEKKGHIGVQNVERIIQLNYGEEYGLKINRNEDKGTTVVMTFPLNGESLGKKEG